MDAQTDNTLERDTDTAASAGSDAGNGKQPGKRRKLLAAVVGVLLAAGAVYGSYWAILARYTETTDNAYVGGNVVQITPQVTGTVVAISVDDTDYVPAGQPLIQLDRADAEIAMQRAQAQLAQTIREVRGLYADTARLQAAVAVRKVELAKARDDLARREKLGNSGAVSNEAIQHARDAVRTGQASLQVAQQQLAANRALTEAASVETHPEVQRAAAALREASLAYQRTTLLAPVSGYVAKRSVQLGQRVSPGVALMAIVPLDQVWVDANFKERQLANIRLGQPVSLHADVYGDKVEFHGTVSGLGAGTGSAFSLLPAQNATGNWIKVVQRLPVRIALVKQELAAHPLRVGLSMDVDVDTHDRSDTRPVPGAHREPVYQTRVFDRQQQAADALVARIIAANLTVKDPSGGGTKTIVAGTTAGEGTPEPVQVARQVPLVSRDGS